MGDAGCVTHDPIYHFPAPRGQIIFLSSSTLISSPLNSSHNSTPQSSLFPTLNLLPQLNSPSPHRDLIHHRLPALSVDHPSLWAGAFTLDRDAAEGRLRPQSCRDPRRPRLAHPHPGPHQLHARKSPIARPWCNSATPRWTSRSWPWPSKPTAASSPSTTLVVWSARLTHTRPSLFAEMLSFDPGVSSSSLPWNTFCSRR